MGYADGVLMKTQIHTLENEFLEMIRGYVPQHWLMEVLKNYVIFRNRNLSDFIPLDYRMEIYATTLGCSDNHPEEGPFYNRLLNYHAAHDVSYMMIDNPFISARDILQNAHNLDDSLKILRDTKVFVSTIWLVGSRTDGKFIVVEKTPDIMNVREAAGDTIICPNHFETPGLKDDPRNTNYMAEATSVSREARLKELLQSSQGTLNATQAVAILRDRDLPGGIFAGDGHRATLNAFIATHATVMDLSDGIFWAASPPNQLGKFVAFDLQDFSHELPALTVTADATLASGEYQRAREAHQCLMDGQRALKKKDAKTALALAEKAEALNPG